MSKSQRTKGAVGEREICDLIFETSELRFIGIYSRHGMAVQTSNSSPSISKSKDVRLLATSTTGLIRLKEDVIFQSVRLLSVELTERNGQRS